VCVQCGKPASFEAAYGENRDAILYFCSEECQKDHWKTKMRGIGSMVDERGDIVTIKRVNLNETIVTKEELGRCSWTYLHMVGAKVDDNCPGPLPLEKQEQLKRYINDFADLYPCSMCGNHFKQLIKQHPPDVSSGRAFMMWICDRHNNVNNRLGKPVWPCNSIECQLTKYKCDEEH